MSIRIAPSLLSADFSRLGEEIRALETAGADMIHLDVMDGHFVPNLTIGPSVIKALRPLTTLPFDVHLMISPVDPLLESFAQAGADILTVHPEAGPHLHRTLQTIKSLGKKAGVALNPATPLSLIEPVLDDIDLLLIMTVNPGFGGQTFIPSMREKIHAARALLNHRAPHVLLEVDGGITGDNAPYLRTTGVDILVAGTAIFSTTDYTGAIAHLRG